MQPDEGSRRQMTYDSCKTVFRAEPYISEARNVYLRWMIFCVFNVNATFITPA